MSVVSDYNMLSDGENEIFKQVVMQVVVNLLLLTTSPKLYISLNFKPLLESGCGTPRKEDSRRRIIIVRVGSG